MTVHYDAWLIILLLSSFSFYQKGIKTVTKVKQSVIGVINVFELRRTFVS